jgi:hypothetical protein
MFSFGSSSVAHYHGSSEPLVNNVFVPAVWKKENSPTVLSLLRWTPKIFLQ